MPQKAAVHNQPVTIASSTSGFAPAPVHTVVERPAISTLATGSGQSFSPLWARRAPVFDAQGRFPTSYPVRSLASHLCRSLEAVPLSLAVCVYSVVLLARVSTRPRHAVPILTHRSPALRISSSRPDSLSIPLQRRLRLWLHVLSWFLFSSSSTSDIFADFLIRNGSRGLFSPEMLT